MKLRGRLLVLLSIILYAACTDCRWIAEGRKLQSGVFVNDTQYVPLFAPPPESSTDSSPVTDTADWPEPVSTVLIVDREAGTVVMRHTEPDGRVVERLFRVPTREDIAAQYYDEGS